MLTAVALTLCLDTLTLPLGTIRAEDGEVTATVQHNTTAITTIRTACSCTRATVTDSTHITVSYNPANRIGPIDELILAYADSDTPVLSLRLTGQVTTDDPFPHLTQPLGRNMRVKRKTITVSNLCDGQRRSEALPCGNISNRPVTIGATMLPPYVSITTTPSPIPPGSEADILFNIDATAAPQGETRLPIFLTGIDGRPGDCLITLIINKP